MVQLYDADRYPIDPGSIVRFEGHEYIVGRISPGSRTIYLHPGKWAKQDEQLIFTVDHASSISLQIPGASVPMLTVIGWDGPLGTRQYSH